MSDLFIKENHAEVYKKNRPQYPDFIVHRIIEFCQRNHGQFDHAIDVACGSGQGTIGLLKHYKNVTGTDISEAQIRYAPKDRPNVEFLVRPAEDLSFAKDESVDLVTVASAIHWFHPLDKFYNEVQRVLKTNGALAVYGYVHLDRIDNERGSESVREFYRELKEKQCWTTGVSGKEDYDVPSPQFCNFNRNTDLEMSVSMPLSKCMGYFRSLSAYQLLESKYPDCNALDKLQKKLIQVYGNGDNPEIICTWPLYLLLAKKELSSGTQCFEH